MQDFIDTKEGGTKTVRKEYELMTHEKALEILSRALYVKKL